MAVTRQIHLVRRPKGVPTLDDFAVVQVEAANPAKGSRDRRADHVGRPYMRPRLNADQALDARCGGGIGG
jgi:NADPH-dependent curcumin reductase CurA